MALEHALELRDHLRVAGRTLAVEGPVRRAAQVVALVGRLVEGRGLGDVDEDRHAEDAGPVPERIEPQVVDVNGGR